MDERLSRITSSTSDEASEDKKKIKMKRYKDKDDFPSVFTDEDTRHRLFSHLPLLKIKKLKKNPKVLNMICGPYDIHFPLDVFESLVCARSISTYPHIPGRPQRDGDPICDSYSIQLLEDDVVIALVCDGCNWGRRPLEASNTAKSSFIEYVRSHQNEFEELRDIGHYLLQALSYCHFKICEGKDDVWEAGTTTLLGGMLIRVKKTKEEVKAEEKSDHREDHSGNGHASKPDSFKWVWVCVSIGDCKAFHFNAKTQVVTDITKGNRRNIYDAKDCGGRLGPYVGNGQPDLGNVTVYYRLCEENDLILMLSDGVHDNLDPQVLGRPPKDCGPDFTSYSDWSEITDTDVATSAKSDFMKNFLANEIILGGGDDEKIRSKVFSTLVEEEMLSPAAITARIMKHCLSVTGKGREWMEQNPREKLPSDYVEYPGKMDHATAVVLRVSKFEKEFMKQQANVKTPVDKQRQSLKN